MKPENILLGILLLFLLLTAFLLLSPSTAPSPRFKTYPTAKKIPLPPPTYEGKTLEKTIYERRSVRAFSEESITLQELSQLLFAAQGITENKSMLRAAPSAGALYPIEIYLIANKVSSLQSGIYHYNVREHSLELLKEGNFSKEICEASLNQQPVRDAAVVFIFTAIFERTKSKYGERGERYIYIEAGHISQNLLLQATSLNLASLPVGGFTDEKVNSLLGVDGKNESAIYINVVGKKS